MKKLGLVLIGLALICGCGYKLGYRHFVGPIQPHPEAGTDLFTIGDDGSITYAKERLEVTLVPLTADMLNRQFPNSSRMTEGFPQPNPFSGAINPYTYGDWKPPEENEPPARFTVFLLKVKNYAYPMVRVKPANITISAPNGRRYDTLSLWTLVEYYRPYAVAYGGNARRSLAERSDLMRRTLFPLEQKIFSGQEKEGYVVFPILDPDVEAFTVWIRDVALRFDFRGDPVEEIDLPYRFQREVYYASQRRAGDG
jgi:hypothetical protein